MIYHQLQFGRRRPFLSWRAMAPAEAQIALSMLFEQFPKLRLRAGSD
jgi:hypothetical protein